MSSSFKSAPDGFGLPWKSTPDGSGKGVEIFPGVNGWIGVTSARAATAYVNPGEVPAMCTVLRAAAGLPEVIEIPVDELPEVKREGNSVGHIELWADTWSDEALRFKALHLLAVLRFREQERAEKANKDAEFDGLAKAWRDWIDSESAERAKTIAVLALARAGIPVPEDTP